MDNERATLRQIQIQIQEMRHQMAVDFTKLRDQIAKNTDVVASAKLLLQKLLAEIEQIATTADEPTQKALDDLTQQFAAQTDDLSAAVAADTAADPANVQPAPTPKPVDPSGGSQ